MPTRDILINSVGLDKQGWAKIQFYGSSEKAIRNELLTLTKQFGEPVPVRSDDDVIAKLVPTLAEEAHPRSLSRRFSTGEFELHNDTAHWITPCRHIILACIDAGEGNRPTLLLDTKDLPLQDTQRELLQTAPMRITNGRTSFYSTILSPGRPFVRFDVGCMSPAAPCAVKAMQIMKRESWPEKVHEFQWEPGTGLVIDNWRMLHGRGIGYQNDPARCLLRVSFL